MMAEPEKLAVTVDILVFCKEKQQLYIALVERKNDPFKGCWAYPGGFVEKAEGLAAAAMRELAEETGLQVSELHQLEAFGDPGRDPRGHTVTIAHACFLETSCPELVADTDANHAKWFPVDALPQLAFDHHDIWEKCSQIINDWVKLGKINARWKTPK